MTGFITNSGTKNLNKRIKELISKSKELKFLVGFFYFSGLSELYSAIKDNPDVMMKVLVGLNVDGNIYNIWEFTQDYQKLSDDERTKNFFDSLKKSINTDVFDNRDFYEQSKFFIELIEKDRLIIRKTLEPNHSKLYIFKLEEGQIARNSLFITGSSNLTRAGLNHQNEFNVEISDYGVDEAEDYFDRLWNSAVKLTEHDQTKTKLINILKEETLIKEITPFEAYAYVLKSYLDTFKGVELSKGVEDLLEKNGYRRYNYQLDAVKQGVSIIERNNGVIIADVVGLGKTIIACAIAYQLKERGVVIAPPSLIGDNRRTSGWKKYLEDFNLYSFGWDVYSSGNLEAALEAISRARDIKIVIVDEAHRFRNEDTKSYEALREICRGKKVILLTATPFNNKPKDIFSMLKLFVIPRKSNITLSDNLEHKFKVFGDMFDKLAFITKNANSRDDEKRQKAENYYEAIFGSKSIDLRRVNKRAHYLAKEIRDVIEPVVIRRNRLDLKENPYYRDEINELSKVEDPIEWFYELDERQSKFYDQIINNYFAMPSDGGMFKGAIYQPYSYEKGEVKEEGKDYFEYLSQFNLYDLMRRLLVKRFESSFGAFKQSLENFKNITQTVLDFVNRTDKYILDRQLIESIKEEPDEVIEQKLKEYAENLKKGTYSKKEKVYEISKFKNREGFLKDIEGDLELFDFILKEVDALKLVDNDPKSEKLISKIKESLEKESHRKIIIFSEYKDTVLHLQTKLEAAFNNRVLTVAGDLPQHKIQEIYKNFDASYHEQNNDYDILLTTDKISEGFNLNRAGMVINYDIPWNPVRVIQRVGRINRISRKVFDSLYIVNFFPTEKGADLVRSREIAQNKMFLIHNALGEDAKIFDIDEEPTPAGLYSKIQQNPEEMEGESFITKIVKEFEAIKNKHPELVKKLEDFPKRIKVAKKGEEDELFVVIKKGRIFIHHKNYALEENNHQIVSLDDVIEKIKAEEKEAALPLSDRFWDAYEEIKRYEERDKARRIPQSIEDKAVNNLKSLLKINDDENVTELKPFIRTLLEDLIDYGTLSEYTIRRLADESKEKALKAVAELKKKLGEDYLKKDKERLSRLTKEIIIAIENRKEFSKE